MKRFRIDIELTVKIIFQKVSATYFALQQYCLNLIVRRIMCARSVMLMSKQFLMAVL